MTDNDSRRPDTPEGRSRRGFLALAGAGAAGAALATAGPAAVGDAAAPAGPRGPLVAHVRDARTGEIAVMAGEHEVVVHDRALAARLARIAR